MGNTYERDKYIEDYKLNKEEIALLPLDIRLAYADKLYGENVACAVGNQNAVHFIGNVHDVFLPYFDKCGCKVTNYDFKQATYSVKSIRKSDFKVDPKNIAIALDYTKEVAKIRSEIFEKEYVRMLEETKAAINSGLLESHPSLEGLHYILCSPLSHETIGMTTKNEIAKREIEALGIEVNEEVSMSKTLPNVYSRVLVEEGYELILEDELKVRRLK